MFQDTRIATTMNIQMKQNDEILLNNDHTNWSPQIKSVLKFKITLKKLYVYFALNQIKKKLNSACSKIKYWNIVFSCSHTAISNHLILSIFNKRIESTDRVNKLLTISFHQVQERLFHSKVGSYFPTKRLISTKAVAITTTQFLSSEKTAVL